MKYILWAEKKKCRCNLCHCLENVKKIVNIFKRLLGPKMWKSPNFQKEEKYIADKSYK